MELLPAILLRSAIVIVKISCAGAILYKFRARLPIAIIAALSFVLSALPDLYKAAAFLEVLLLTEGYLGAIPPIISPFLFLTHPARFLCGIAIAIGLGLLGIAMGKKP